MDQATTAKRKQTEYLDNIDQKKAKIDDIKHPCYILQLPKCVLSVLLSYLDASSLYSLGETCQRFRELTQLPRLWRYIDARNEPHSPDKFRRCCELMHEGTTHFLFRAESRATEIVSDRFFQQARTLRNLKVLALENQYICGETYQLKIFPPSIEELSLRRTYVHNGFNFFRFSSALDRLRVLILDNCQWVETSNLVPIANLKALEILSLYMCKRLSDLDIGYLSLSGDYGLKKLKILNARFTATGNQLLSSLYKSPTLQELYFQCYSTTYHLDHSRRKLDLSRGAKREENSYSTYDEDDSKKKFLMKLYGAVSFHAQNTDVVDDRVIAMYRHVDPCETDTEPPKSFLFKGPYPECTCDFQRRFWDKKEIAKHASTSGAENDEVEHLKKVVRKWRKRLRKCLKNLSAPPIHFACCKMDKRREVGERFRWIRERRPVNDEEVAQLERTIVEREPVDQRFIVCTDGNTYVFNSLPEDWQLPDSPDASQYSDNTSDEDDATSDEEDGPEPPAPPPPPPRAPPEQYLRIVFHGVDQKPRCSLRRLSLRGYPNVTDASLRHLNHLRLELLDVSHTNVTMRGITEFMVDHPNCRVIHEKACTCGPRMHF